MRHGDVSYFDAAGKPLDPRHVPLTDSGRLHALAASEMLADVPFDHAVCSGLLRSEQTARLVLAQRDLPLRHEERFKEIKAGRLRAVPAEQREQVIAYAYDGAGIQGARFIDGERWEDFRVRVLAAWADLLGDASWLNLLIVAHDAVNRVLLSEVAGAGLQGLKAFEQEPACVNIIEVDVEAGCLRRSFFRAINLVAYDQARLGCHLTVMEQVFREFRGE